MKRRILLMAIAALLVARCGPDPGQRERVDDGERSAAVVSEESDQAPTQSPPRSLEFTYPGHPRDALYRDLANAVFAFERREFLRRGSDCGDQPIDWPRAEALRRQHALARASYLVGSCKRARR